MKKFALAILAANLLFVSCKKDEKTANQTTNVRASDYFPMAVGNYWIYESYAIDSNGVETNLNQEDSVYVSATTSHNGETYFQLESQYNICFQGHFRDSSGYLINTSGNIQFAPNDFSDSLSIDIETNGRDTLFIGVYKMEKVVDPIVVPAGSFETLLCRSSYDIYVKAPLKKRELLEYRSPEIGIVSKQCAGIGNPLTIESRLVRYHVN
ncbi:hypothetical protein Oweho_2613 [Owenweeksia hongkongensis DSM 17368]|uniref:Uncharacterized protein n=1 Tax=Owenweeksia hongkongensis (strain DSM 17368 / CIP 108786 / JCM 12287 / NRRL B-23963 / UST20020801) TaxID=926562 RepID=G8R8X3_OWEHD|nr:hypothetical protein [Owenweeksia hongkongensis]AEV33581.1 hypothetical protein Oweho_2613 [Owenweeksia hongkongensis DSM 17368]